MSDSPILHSNIRSCYIFAVNKAFDLFLDPSSRLTGQFAEAVGDWVNLYEFPKPSMVFLPHLGACFLSHNFVVAKDTRAQKGKL